ncbi:unnamed protein product [Cercospora beticola]|nr:unnamed protein product [Cercospora beticola]
MCQGRTRSTTKSAIFLVDNKVGLTASQGQAVLVRLRTTVKHAVHLFWPLLAAKLGPRNTAPEILRCSEQHSERNWQIRGLVLVAVDSHSRAADLSFTEDDGKG